jgi:hypothetical protein
VGAKFGGVTPIDCLSEPIGCPRGRLLGKVGEICFVLPEILATSTARLLCFVVPRNHVEVLIRVPSMVLWF